MAAIRVVLVDDQELFAEGLVALFDEPVPLTVDVCDLIHDPTEAVARIAAAAPDVAVIDLRMEPVDGVAVIEELRSAQPDLPVLVLTGVPGRTSVAEALAAGATSWVSKTVDASVLACALYLTGRGYSVVALANGPRPTFAPPGREVRRELSAQDVALLRLNAEGASYEAMAQALHVSARTARRWMDELQSRLGVPNRLAAAELTGRLRLLDEADVDDA